MVVVVVLAAAKPPVAERFHVEKLGCAVPHSCLQNT